MSKIIGEGITFDDVLLVPAYSEVIPNQVDISTWLTNTISAHTGTIKMKNIGMNIKMSMDTTIPASMDRTIFTVSGVPLLRLTRTSQKASPFVLLYISSAAPL